VESRIGIAAGPLPNSKWIETYARLGYGLLTYKTVRTTAREAYPMPNLVFCRDGEPAVAEPRAPRRLDPAAVTWAVSLGLPSAPPEQWRADVRRARARMRPTQALLVSIAGTPVPGGGPEELADDYALCARWAAEAGADVVEIHLSCPNTMAEHAQMIYENLPLSALVVERVRRAIGGHPAIVKCGSFPSPRAVHDLASRLAPWVDGFLLVNGIQRRVVKPDGSPAFPGSGRELAGVSGAAIYGACLVQVEEMVAWRKAGAWNRTILAVGGITSVERVRAAFGAGADAVMVATAALVDPLIAARHRLLG
jgi:dihydroorotate dehydrogenase